MLKMSEYTGKPVKNGDVGIEVEVEFKKGSTPVTTGIPEYWLAHNDESLKNGMEYVSRQPFKVGPTLISKIKGLTTALHNLGNVDEGNPRASVHVHVNVQEKTPSQVWCAIIAYWLLENIIVKYCAEHRRGNHFCLQLQDAPGILQSCYQELATTSYPFCDFHPNSCKYGAVNLATVWRYGSLEFRSLQATTDPDIIHEWSTSLHYLVNKAATFETPDKIMDFYLESTKDSFLYAMLPYEFASKLTSLCDDYKIITKKNKRYLAELAYFHDWSAWQARHEKRRQDYLVAVNTMSSSTPTEYIFTNFNTGDD